MVGRVAPIRSICIIGVGVWLATAPAFAAVTLTAIYDAGSGNLSLRALNEFGADAPLPVDTFQFLSPAQYLSGQAAAIPAAAVSFATVLNTDESQFFEPPLVSAEIFASNFGGSTPLFNGTWDLGSVAATGLSASQIISGFTTDPDVSPGGVALAGRFLYQVQGRADFLSGPITFVPEPSGVVLAAVGTLALWMSRRLSRWTSVESGPSKGNSASSVT